MMRLAKQMIAGWLVVAATIAVGQANNASQKSDAKADPQKGQPAATDRGQQVFNQNCLRCHNTPEGFSPSISGTIAKHMRVRAGLSDKDYKALLKFFNP